MWKSTSTLSIKSYLSCSWWPQLHFTRKHDASPNTTRKMYSFKHIWSSLFLQVCVRAICQTNEKDQNNTVQPVKACVDIFLCFFWHILSFPCSTQRYLLRYFFHLPFRKCTILNWKCLRDKISVSAESDIKCLHTCSRKCSRGI